MTRNAILIIISALALCCCLSNTVDAAQRATLSVLPFYSSDKVLFFYTPLINYLNNATGMSWELKLHSNYDDLLDNLCKGEISVAYIGPVSFARAHERCKAKPLLVILNKDGKPYFSSIIFTANKDIKSIEDLKGKRFAFGPRSSTASFVMPRKMLEEKGITMNMIKPIFYKNHDDIIQAVLTGQADGGAVRDSIYEQFYKTSLKIISATGDIPHHTFCASSGISKELEKGFTNALLALKPLTKSADREIVSSWDPDLRYGFIKPPKDYLQRTSELLKLYNTYNP